MFSAETSAGVRSREQLVPFRCVPSGHRPWSSLSTLFRSFSGDCIPCSPSAFRASRIWIIRSCFVFLVSFLFLRCHLSSFLYASAPIIRNHSKQPETTRTTRGHSKPRDNCFQQASGSQKGTGMFSAETSAGVRPREQLVPFRCVPSGHRPWSSLSTREPMRPGSFLPAETSAGVLPREQASGSQKATGMFSAETSAGVRSREQVVPFRCVPSGHRPSSSLATREPMRRCDQAHFCRDVPSP